MGNAVATMLAQEPRPLEQIVADAIHHVDAIMRQHRARIEESEDVSVKDLSRLEHLSQIAHALASSAIGRKLLTFRLAQGRLDAAMDRAVLLGVVDQLLEHLGASDEPAVKLWLIRALQAAVREAEAWQASGSFDLEVEAVQHRAGDRSPLADAVGEVPWDADLVVMTRADVAELERLRGEAERQRAAKALAAAPFSAPVPVMGRPGVPGMPGGWRSVEDDVDGIPPGRPRPRASTRSTTTMTTATTTPWWDTWSTVPQGPAGPMSRPAWGGDHERRRRRPQR